jgi:spore germination cell wall hydrolase CwlJ-like protein
MKSTILKIFLEWLARVLNPAKPQWREKRKATTKESLAVQWSKEDLANMAATIFGEARNEPENGKWAVGHVILNRAKANKAHWGIGISGVCRKPLQFSCWNKNDPNAPRCHDVYRDVMDEAFEEMSRAAAHCYNAALAVREGVEDPTGGATHYYAPAGMKALVARGLAKSEVPAWAKGRTPTATIGGHIFYKLEA